MKINKVKMSDKPLSTFRDYYSSQVDQLSVRGSLQLSARNSLNEQNVVTLYKNGQATSRIITSGIKDMATMPSSKMKGISTLTSPRDLSK